MITAKPSSLGHMPDGQWQFDRSVTDVFDDMLERSIPGYETMRRIVTDVGMQFVQPQTDIVDLGCSRGGALVPFVNRYGAHNRYTGVEVSEPMRHAFAETFAGYPKTLVRCLDLDLRKTYPFVDASLTLAVLTFIFIPINYRQRIMHDIARHTRSGGAVILVEKTIGTNGVTDPVLVALYHAMKMAHGYTQEEVERKALALEGVQVPVTGAWNEDMLRNAGFPYVEPIWRELNFAAWIGVKP